MLKTKQLITVTVFAVSMLIGLMSVLGTQTQYGKKAR